jgi:hypothetical protein
MRKGKQVAACNWHWKNRPLQRFGEHLVSRNGNCQSEPMQLVAYAWLVD